VLPAELLVEEDARIRALLAEAPGAAPVDIERVALIAAFYKLLYHKYQLDHKSLRHHLEQLDRESFPDLERLRAALDEPELKQRLFMLMDYLERLKAVILSDEPMKSGQTSTRNATSPSTFRPCTAATTSANSMHWDLLSDRIPDQRPVRRTGGPDQPGPDHPGHVSRHL
jgi:hypothetical protein